VGYTAVKGGADAIAAAEKLIQTLPRDPGEPGLEIRQLRHQLGAAVDKVVGEGGVYAPDLAAQAILQTEGDLFEAAFTLRAYRSTLPRLGYAEAVRGTQMRLRRRISSAFRARADARLHAAIARGVACPDAASQRPHHQWADIDPG
jgi:alpha-D-ribose 1-methylphosphonate 5-triphosphate synthase subunit PhnI